jgi:putative SOS response-associated peptidase YedK
MPDRYSICSSREVLEQRFKVEVTDRYIPRYNAAPTQILPVITLENPDGFSFFYWGLHPSWSKNRSISKKLINSESELLLEKASLRKAVKSRRCLVPADGFYLWKKVGKKTRIPYRIFMKQPEPFAIAGLWEEFEDEKDEMIHTFSMITVKSNALVADIDERMPAILRKEDEDHWLRGHIEIDELMSCLIVFPSEMMMHHPVSARINSPEENSSDLLRPVQPADQHGNYTLFS